MLGRKGVWAVVLSKGVAAPSRRPLEPCWLVERWVKDVSLVYVECILRCLYRVGVVVGV
jgi:hypothetical protein